MSSNSIKTQRSWAQLDDVNDTKSRVKKLEKSRKPLNSSSRHSNMRQTIASQTWLSLLFAIKIHFFCVWKICRFVASLFSFPFGCVEVREDQRQQQRLCYGFNRLFGRAADLSWEVFIVDTLPLSRSFAFRHLFAIFLCVGKINP